MKKHEDILKILMKCFDKGMFDDLMKSSGILAENAKETVLSDRQERYKEAKKMIRSALELGVTPTQTAVSKQFSMGRRTAGILIQETKEEFGNELKSGV